MNDLPRLALTFLVEGDWAAAPGSSPEALGWDLAPQNVPSPLGASDLPRAAAAWNQAEQLLQGFDLPRFRSALALRRAALARANGDVPAKRQFLAAARDDAAARSGDSAAYHLAAMHMLVADIDEGLLGRHQLDLGGGWHPPSRGPVADLLDLGGHGRQPQLVRRAGPAAPAVRRRLEQRRAARPGRGSPISLRCS